MSLDVNISEPEEFNCVELHSSIEDVAKLKDIKDFEYHVDYISGKGDNYIANIFRVLIKDTSKEDNNLSVIVKTLINTTHQELFHELHKREVMVYKEVIPKFESIQSDLDEEKRVILPKCLNTNADRGRETLILNDLLLDGFDVADSLIRYDNPSIEQVKLVATELARFHALSFVLEKKRTDDYEQLKAKFTDILFQEKFLNKSRLRTYFSDSFSTSLKVVKDLEIKQMLGAVVAKLLAVLRKFVEPRTYYSVLCHGDCWLNNILFKEQENGVNRACLLDFQAMRYTSPVSDLIHFIYLSTNSHFRSQNFEDIKNCYHNALKSFLALYNINIDEVYPKEIFNNDIKDFQPYGLLIALVELRIVTVTPEEETPDRKRNKVLESNYDENHEEPKLFEIRVNDVVNESRDNGVLDRLMLLVKNC